jgi:uncharacterized protein (TIGR03067 family)
LPIGLPAVLAKMTAKQPAERYQTAAETAEALEPFTRDASSVRRRNHLRTLAAAGLLFAALLAVAAVIFKIERDNQEITIQTDDPDIEVVMKRKGEVLRVIDRKSEQTWIIDTATNQIAQAEHAEGLKLSLPENEAVVLRRAGQEVFRVTRLPNDRKLIQGVWRGVAMELAGQTMPTELIQAIQPTLTFTAEAMTARPVGTLPKAFPEMAPKGFLEMAAAKGMTPRLMAAIAEKGVTARYHLDPTKSPRTIDIFTLGEPRKVALGLYRLEGDTLRLCLSVDPERLGDRPTEFATRAGEMRAIVTLKRMRVSDVPAPK